MILLIVKKHEPPGIIVNLEVLLRRLPKSYSGRNEIEHQLGNFKAGYHGELSLDYYLNRLPEKEYLILHDLRLFIQSAFFQIDTLILHRNFILILEVKNIAGEIYIDTTYNQMIRNLNGKIEVFQDPILQSHRQKKDLESWLVERNYPSIPVENIVVFTNPHSHIKNSSQDHSVYQKVIRSAKLPFQIESYFQSHQNPSLSPQQVTKLTKAFLKHHIPQSYNLLKQFNISQSFILHGVYCVQCQSGSMERISGTWRCGRCLSVQKDAHTHALRDYAFLINTFITNKQTREFLKLESTSTARKLLQKLALPSTGSTRDRAYNLSPLMATPPSPPEMPALKSSKKRNSQSPHNRKKSP
ncbi:nuclease-related domain-containing protein [Rossellomorea vietnamensis]|uniref:nuclease-related domain-containing protein n=1 Tax=Rossellomorea vietnamensis TaxID=218284 RepID=UPI003B679D09